MIEIQLATQLSTADLIQEVEREIQMYLHAQVAIDASSSSYELFRRAIVENDEHAWIGIYTLYASLVSSWIIRLKNDVSQEDLLSLMNGTFAKFARSSSAHRFADFPNVSHLLAYLKKCAQSIFFDAQRSRQWQMATCESYEEILKTLDTASSHDDPANTVETILSLQEIWRIISTMVTAQEELLILHQCCLAGCTPSELQRLYPTIYPSIDDVYRIKRNVLQRLRRNRQLQAYFSERTCVS